MSHHPDVAYISPDRPIHAALYSNDPDLYEQAVFVPSSWNQYDGSGIGIAVIDSGITNSANLINLRVLDPNGSATESAVIAAIQKAIQLKITYNIRIINRQRRLLSMPTTARFCSSPLLSVPRKTHRLVTPVIISTSSSALPSAHEGLLRLDICAGRRAKTRQGDV